LFLTVAAAAIAIVVSSESMFARGGDAAKIMPGAISGGFRNPASRCRNPTRSHLRPLDANGDIGVSTEVLLTVRGTGHFGRVMNNRH
jgi:hypothetical protein